MSCFGIHFMNSPGGFFGQWWKEKEKEIKYLVLYEYLVFISISSRLSNCLLAIYFRTYPRTHKLFFFYQLVWQILNCDYTYLIYLLSVISGCYHSMYAHTKYSHIHTVVYIKYIMYNVMAILSIPTCTVFSGQTEALLSVSIRCIIFSFKPGLYTDLLHYSWQSFDRKGAWTHPEAFYMSLE